MKIDDDDILERELRRALARREPAKDFSTLVYSRPETRFWTRSRGLLALAAALLVMLLVPVEILRYQARQQRAEEASRQLVTALRITGSKLQKTRQMVVRGLNRRNSL